jgi:hypothetical protein
MSLLKLRDADTGESELRFNENERKLILTVVDLRDWDQGIKAQLVLDRQGEDELFRFLLRRQRDIANRLSGSLG